MIEVKNLVKTYGRRNVVDNISFVVNEGEILGFLGPNGAGKSTIMNIITGYTSSTSGTVTVNGREILADPIKVKSQIGYLPEHPPLYRDMIVGDYLSFMYDLKKVKSSSFTKKDHIYKICNLVNITNVSGRIIKNLSKGYQQRVGLAQALLGNPQVVILDEPTVGLDPKQIIEIRNLIKDLGKKYTIIWSSHILSEIQATCERVIVIDKGRIIADGSPDSLSHTTGADAALIIRVAGPENGIKQLLEAIPHVIKVTSLGSREKDAFEFLVETEPDSDVRREIFQQLSAKAWPILGLKSGEMTLEDIFLRLTEDSEETLQLAEVDQKSK